MALNYAKLRLGNPLDDAQEKTPGALFKKGSKGSKSGFWLGSFAKDDDDSHEKRPSSPEGGKSFHSLFSKGSKGSKSGFWLGSFLSDTPSDDGQVQRPGSPQSRAQMKSCSRSASSLAEVSWQFPVSTVHSVFSERSVPGESLGMPMLGSIRKASYSGDVVKCVSEETSDSSTLSAPLRAKGPMDKKRRHMRQFQKISRKDAVKLACEGEFLQKQNDEEQYTQWTQWRSVLRRVLNYKSQLYCNYYFVVVNCKEPWLAELRWGETCEIAVGVGAAGRVLLANVRHVTATVLRDGDVDPNLNKDDDMKTREFRVVCVGRTLKLWAQTRESMQKWVTAIVRLASLAQGVSPPTHKHDNNTMGMKSYIERLLAQGGVSKVTSTEALADVISKKLNITVTSAQVKEIMTETDTEVESDKVDTGTFTDLFLMLTVKDALSIWFAKYAVPSHPDDLTICQPVLTKDRFQAFMEVVQREPYFFCNCRNTQELFANLKEPHTIETAQKEAALTESGFSYLMCCAENSIFDPCRRAEICQDMSRPLSHYWIASSHNTYLEGHQLVGQSSLHQYIEVLMNGCRCVEIDCWDGDAGEPVVTHGWTMTSKLLFSDVIRVCRDYGFVVSPYPLILSLEVHCGTKQTERMGAILNDILGDSLLTHSDSDHPELISPDTAQFKFLVKAKIPAVRNESKKSTLNSLTLRNSETALARLIPRLSWRSNQSLGDMASASSTSGEQNTPSESSSKAIGKSEDLKDESASDSISVYTRSIGMPTVKLPKNAKQLPTFESDPCSCTSFNEKAATAALAEYGLQNLRTHHRARLSRVFPHATRVGSDNYDPLPLWLAGFQMVALNYQSVDLPMLLNTGLFMHENGGCGYVLKPVTVQGDIETNGDYAQTLQDAQDAIASELECTLDLIVLSGHWLPKPPEADGSESAVAISPLVRVSLCGASEDQYVAETRSIVENGFNPYWNELFEFKIKRPSLAILAFEVVNTSDTGELEFIAAAAIPLTGLREGIRWVPLLDWRYQAIDLCGLLVDARPKGPWADLRRQQRLERAPIKEDVAAFISFGPGGISAQRMARGRTRRVGVKSPSTSGSSIVGKSESNLSKNGWSWRSRSTFVSKSSSFYIFRTCSEEEDDNEIFRETPLLVWPQRTLGVRHGVSEDVGFPSNMQTSILRGSARGSSENPAHAEPRKHLSTEKGVRFASERERVSTKEAFRPDLWEVETDAEAEGSRQISAHRKIRGSR